MSVNRLSTDEYLILIDRVPDSIYGLHERPISRFPIHTHKKGQITYVRGGVAWLFIGRQNGQNEGNTYVVPARHFIWVPAGVPHYVIARSPNAAIITLYYPAKGDRADDFYSRIGIYPINNLLYEMLVYSEKWSGEVLPRDRPYHFLWSIKDILPDLGSQGLPIILPTSTHTRLQPIIQYLKANVAQDLSLKKISHEFGISERSLARLFKDNLDLSFLQYLKQMRMILAVEMILQTNMNLSQIAYAVGYGSLAAFSSTFFQVCKVRPSEFARRVK